MGEKGAEKGNRVPTMETNLSIVTLVEILQEIRAALVLWSQVLDKTFSTHNVLTNNVVPLLCLIHKVPQLFHSLEEKHVNDL